MLLSICPFLKGMGGHDIPYQQSLRAAVRDTLQIRVLGTTAAKNINLPVDFAALLPVYTSRKSIAYWFSYISTIRRELVKKESSGCSIFIESFGLGHLLGLGFALFLSDNKIDQLIILIRSNLIVNKLYKKVVFKGVLFCFQNLLKTKIVLCSDSALICNFIYKEFRIRVVLLPIPHTALEVEPQSDQQPSSQRAIICWLPGSNRPEKKYDVAAKLINSSDRLNQIILWMSGSLKYLAPFQGQHFFFEKALSEEDYKKTLVNCDVVLLPYDSHIYEMATSGIFVECIIAGKWPITSKNSWMSYELIRYGLHELSIMWEHENSESELLKALSLMNDKKYLDRLGAMRKEYLNFHCQNKFKDILKSLLIA